MGHQLTLSESLKHKIATCELQWLLTYPWIYAGISILFHANPLQQALEKAFVDYNPAIYNFYRTFTSLNSSTTFKIVLLAMKSLQTTNRIPLARISSLIPYVQSATVTPAKPRSKLTKGGKQSSAALRGTENPPWVLVSEAVSVLQNIWGVLDGGTDSCSSMHFSFFWRKIYWINTMSSMKIFNKGNYFAIYNFK